MKIKLLTLFLILSCLLLITTNFYFIQKCLYYYRISNAMRLDPIGLNQFEVNPSIKNAKLVFFGDSRAEQWPVPDWYKSNSINLGIGQQTSAQAVLRLEKQEEYINDCIVLIQIGVNDLKTIPLFPERKEEIVKNCIKNIEKLIRDLEHAGNKVIVSTIFPIGDVPLTRSLVWSNDVDTAVIEVNKSIHATKSESVMIFDAYSLLAGEQRKVKKEFSFDMLHLSNEGYSFLNDSLKNMLSNI